MKFFTLLITALFFLKINAQNFSINGTVFNEKQEVISDAVVTIDKDSNYTITNSIGYFEFSDISPGEHLLKVQLLGYQTFSNSIYVSKNNSLKIILKKALTSLNDVVVTGKTKLQKKREAPIKVEVIEIQKVVAQASTMQEIVNQVAGVKFRQNAGVGSATNININGLQGQAIRYFKDGIPTQYLGRAFDIGLIPTGIVNNIEIYKGVLPITLGADALGGAIDITTKAKDEQYGNASYEIQSFNTHIFNLSTNLIIPKTNIHFGINSYYVSSDNDYEFDFKENRDGVIETIRAKRFQDEIAAAYSAFNIGVHNKKYADLLDFQFAYFDWFDEVQNSEVDITVPFNNVVRSEINRILSFRYKHHLLSNWTIDVFGALSKKTSKDQDLGNRRVRWNGNFATDFNGNFIKLDGEIRKRDQVIKDDSKVARIASAYEVNKHFTAKLSSTYNSNERVGDDPFGLVNAFNGIQPITIPSKYTKIISGFGIGTSHLNGLLATEVFAKHYYLETVSPNFFGSSLSENLFDNSYGYGTSAKFGIDQNSYLRVSYEKATRIPEADEFFGDNLFVLPNSELKPERSENINVTINSNINKKNTLSFEINGFYRDTKDFIRIFPQNIIFSENKNSDTQITKGVELTIKAKPDKTSNISLAVTYQDLRRKETIGTDRGLEDSRTPNIPYFFGNLNACKKFLGVWGKPYDINIYGNYNFTEQYFFKATSKNLEPALFEESPRAITSLIPAQSLVNLGTTLIFKKLPITLNFEIGNLLNEELFDDFRIPKAPRNYRGKITFKF